MRGGNAFPTNNIDHVRVASCRKPCSVLRVPVTCPYQGNPAHHEAFTSTLALFLLAADVLNCWFWPMPSSTGLGYESLAGVHPASGSFPSCIRCTMGASHDSAGIVLSLSVCCKGFLGSRLLSSSATTVRLPSVFSQVSSCDPVVPLPQKLKTLSIHRRSFFFHVFSFSFMSFLSSYTHNHIYTAV